MKTNGTGSADERVGVAAAPVVLDTRVVTGSGGGPEKTILNSPRFLGPAGYRMLCAYMHPPDDPGFEAIRRRAEALLAQQRDRRRQGRSLRLAQDPSIAQQPDRWPFQGARAQHGRQEKAAEEERQAGQRREQRTNHARQQRAHDQARRPGKRLRYPW